MPYRESAPKGTVDRATREFSQEFDSVINRLVAEQDPPAGSRRVSEARKVALWGIEDRRVDPVLLKQRLLTTGLGDEARQMSVVQEHPDNADLAMAYANGIAQMQGVQDPEGLADQLVDMARWPYRWGLLEHINDPVEMTRESNRLERAWLNTQDQSTATDASMTEDLPAPSAPMEPTAGGYAGTEMGSEDDADTLY